MSRTSKIYASVGVFVAVVTLTPVGQVLLALNAFIAHFVIWNVWGPNVSTFWSLVYSVFQFALMCAICYLGMLWVTRKVYIPHA